MFKKSRLLLYTTDSDSFTPRYQFYLLERPFPSQSVRSNNSVNKTSGGGTQKDRVYRGRPNKSGEEGRGARGFWWADRKLKPSISATL